MTKTLLSAVLVATQVLSWQASPLYLCLSADGSMCVDFGPSGCHCRDASGHAGCSHEHHACTASDREHAVCEHGCCEHGQLAESDQANPCGCDHIQISEPQAATRVRVVVAPDAPHLVMPPTALPSQPVSSFSFAADGTCALALSSGRASPNPTHVLLASVVIQC